MLSKFPFSRRAVLMRNAEKDRQDIDCVLGLSAMRVKTARKGYEVHAAEGIPMGLAVPMLSYRNPAAASPVSTSSCRTDQAT